VHFRSGLLDYCTQRGIVLEAYSPLDHGRALEQPVIVEIARRMERTPAQVMLRWSIQHDVVVIPKSRHRERIRANAEIFDFALSAPDMQALDRLDTSGGAGTAR
jgi:diketogulonate reductase-like aldo/keto reductase